MRGLILYNSYMKLDSQINQVNRFKEEFEKKNIEVDCLRTSCLSTLINNGIEYKLNEKYDFCLYLDKDKYVSKMLEEFGLKVFNNSRAIELSDDKMLTHIELAKYNFPQPKTIPGLLCYSEGTCVDEEYLNKVENELSFPLVVKECYGSLGYNVYLVDNHNELLELSNKLIAKPHLFQQFIKSSYGRDIRVLCIGHKAVAWMERRSNDDFRSNIGQNGKGFKIDLPENFKKCAEEVSKILDLDFCGIDLLIDENKNPIVCEVNPKAFFNTLEEVSGVNVAKAFVDYIISYFDK